MKDEGPAVAGSRSMRDRRMKRRDEGGGRGGEETAGKRLIGREGPLLEGTSRLPWALFWEAHGSFFLYGGGY